MLPEYSNYTYEAKDTEGLGGTSGGSSTTAASLVPEYEVGLEDFWTGFETFLTKTNNHRGTRDRLSYARRYCHILKTKDAHELLELTNEKRIHAMKSLSSLAKYTGCYDSWQSIRQNFQLKWSSGDSLYAFASIFDSKKDLEHMLLWLTQTCSRIPERYANILIFNTLTGLRPSEACMSLKLIHDNVEGYLSSDSHTLEHFRFPNIFIRRTKKAYVSIINDQIMKIAKDAEKKASYNSLKLLFRRNGIDMNMSFCRKIFATFLRTEGIEQEIIDLLQGRLPRSVFVRHYFRPNFEEQNRKVTNSLEKLYQKIRL